MQMQVVAAPPQVIVFIMADDLGQCTGTAVYIYTYMYYIRVQYSIQIYFVLIYSIVISFIPGHGNVGYNRQNHVQEVLVHA